MGHDFNYQGLELELFANAANWKSYWASIIRPYIGVRVLEVGAGLGTTALQLCDPTRNKWVALEPDVRMAEKMMEACARARLPRSLEVVTGTLASINSSERFDSILYIDVLEHIENDKEELDQASMLLETGGHLIVLAPAHQFLFSPFDKAIGHFRRYNRSLMKDVTPTGVTTTRMDFLDSVGLIASLGNRLFLKSSMPSRRQIEVWDSVMVPASRAVDRLIAYNLGKSILGVWTKI